ncbi:aminomethyl-transferring glycine dehydrogenase subunit GcvPB [Candidatus Woesearchaeota archaeon]|nr:aminomethyl-transferring glycine dehydrogenase subunit GcvPB [Candidatus Woesearchaeota archaeon]
MKPLNELSREGAGGYRLPKLEVPPQPQLPQSYLRAELKLPQLTEHDVIREFMGRSHANTSVDGSPLFPLGSCTMIYTPIAARKAPELFAQLHPLQPAQTAQGALKLMHDLERILSEMGGAAAGSLQPAAGAHSELTAMFMIAAYHKSKGEDKQRRVVLIPDSAHGTNPASAAMAGYAVETVPSDKRGRLDYARLEEVLREKGESVAAFMITQPSTYGIYDEKINDITALLHRHGAQVFCDGANFAALTNRVKFGDLGVDVFHFNLHKTFGVPHGGGGPGAGFVGAAEHLVPFLPVPRVEERNGRFELSHDHPQSIGTLSSAYGNFLADVMAYAYIQLLGSEGFREASGVAVLTGNYMHRMLSEVLPPAFPGLVMHEGIVLDTPLRKLSLKVMDLVKGIIDLGYYAPTVSFPLGNGILTEPTHSASRGAIDGFAQDVAEIVKHAEQDPLWLAASPHNTPARRFEEAKANRNPVFIWRWH